MPLARKRLGNTRRSPRRPLRKQVEIVTGMGSSLKSSLLDVSADGARLAAGDGWSVPDVFLCVLGPKVKRWCQIVWRTEREIGVKFVPSPASLTASRQSFPLGADAPA